MLISGIFELCQIFAAFMNLGIMLIFIRAVTQLSILKISGFFFLLRLQPLKLQALLFASFKLFFFYASCRNQEIRAEERSVYILKLCQEPTMRIEVS